MWDPISLNQKIENRKMGGNMALALLEIVLTCSVWMHRPRGRRLCSLGVCGCTKHVGGSPAVDVVPKWTSWYRDQCVLYRPKEILLQENMVNCPSPDLQW